MKKLVEAVNGNIRNSKRLVQLNKICLILNINLKEPKRLNKENG
jgi:ubiquinol-cytochrome c reductase cytochrome b subunit